MSKPGDWPDGEDTARVAAPLICSECKRAVDRAHDVLAGTHDAHVNCYHCGVRDAGKDGHNGCDSSCQWVRKVPCGERGARGCDDCPEHECEVRIKWPREGPDDPDDAVPPRVYGEYAGLEDFNRVCKLIVTEEFYALSHHDAKHLLAVRDELVVLRRRARGTR